MKPITEAKFLTDDERERLLSTLRKYPLDRDSLALQLIYYTGARGCEVLALRGKDFAWDIGAVTIRGAKGSNDRTVPLPREVLVRLREYSGSLSPEERLFPYSTRYLRYVWDRFRPCTKGVHSLRHTGGILLYLNCRDINVVRAFLGHKNINNTMVYLDFVMGAGQLKKAMKGMWGQKVLG